MKKCSLLCITLAFLLFNLLNISLYASDSAELTAVAIDNPPVIDGNLNDDCWQRNPDIEGLWTICSPGYGDELPFPTKVWIAYDEENIYIAFYAYDDDPSQIKANITKRDNIFEDDWVGFNIDMQGNKQSGYGLFVNPLGIQGDLHDTGWMTDDATDYVWDSAGKIVTDGYTVEFKVPLKNFRYLSGKEVKMNIIFERQIARFSNIATWPDKKPGYNYVSAQTGILLKDIPAAFSLDVLPSITYGRIWDRETPDSWSDDEGNIEFGVSAKYAISSQIKAEVTINPDFSQVETDSFQILVNQRYPVFFTEKRSFFMESNNLFNIACSDESGDYYMYRAVHTRNIVDPEWGFKLTGDTGNLAFGFLAAGDEWPGKNVDVDSDLAGKNANYLIGRLKYNFNNDTYVGAIYTGRTFGEGYNHVIGADFSLKFLEHHFIKGRYLYSETKNENTLLETDGSASAISYWFYTKPFSAFINFEDYSEDFQMDSAFYLRNGFNRLMGYLSPNIYPDEEDISWLKRLNFMLWGYTIEDYFTDENEYLYFAAMRAYFPLQGSIRVDWRNFREFYGGKRLEGDYFFAYGQIFPANWLYIYSTITTGDKIYYDSSNPLVGDGITYQGALIFMPNENLSQEFTYTYDDMYWNDEKLYDVHIVTSKTTYQFNKYLFLRAIVQYDSSEELILTDLLASFTYIPGTVIHLGYGSMHQDYYWNNRWESNNTLSSYYQMSQSLFLKVSYLFQF